MSLRENGSIAKFQDSGTCSLGIIKFSVRVLLDSEVDFKKEINNNE